MDYKFHYDALINRSRNRLIDKSVYTEIHHIVPRCMGGTDESSNLATLTPEEHFVAHQLLIKIYPSNNKLVVAAMMMTVAGTGQVRNNKKYGWLRRAFSVSISAMQTGEKNSQYGTVWVSNLDLNLTKKVNKKDVVSLISQGWVKGRKLECNKKQTVCSICNRPFYGNKVTCSNICFSTLVGNRGKLRNPLLGREQEFLDLYGETGSMNLALKKMGFPGATSHYYVNAKNILNNKE